MQGMGDLLEEALQQSSPQQKTQLQYVLHQLHEVIGQEVQDMDEDQKDDEDDEVMGKMSRDHCINPVTGPYPGGVWEVW